MCASFFLFPPLSRASRLPAGDLRDTFLVIFFLNARNARKRLEESHLEQGTPYFKTIFDESPIGIELFDARGRLMDANKASLEIFGVSRPGDLKGFDLFEDPNLPEEAKERLRRNKGVHCEIAYVFEKAKERKLYKTD
ncbi:MAG: PAS domain-containing protein, partial [Endomicrobiales bacterium]